MSVADEGRLVATPSRNLMDKDQNQGAQSNSATGLTLTSYDIVFN